MIADYLRGPGPRAGHIGRLKSPHVLNLISSIKFKNKTFIIFFQLREREGLHPTLLMALTWRGGSNTFSAFQCSLNTYIERYK